MFLFFCVCDFPGIWSENSFLKLHLQDVVYRDHTLTVYVVLGTELKL